MLFTSHGDTACSQLRLRKNEREVRSLPASGMQFMSECFERTQGYKTTFPLNGPHDQSSIFINLRETCGTSQGVE